MRAPPEDRNSGRAWRAGLVAVGVAALAGVAGGCDTGIPDGVEAVRDLDAERYLGTWYSIARLDHRFERGLTDVSADYSMRDDGSIRVVNQGWDPEKEEWSEARGVARFIESPTVGRLKVSFFRPFYGGYNIIALDRDGYEWVMVCGPNRGYLWILARSPELDEAVVDRLLERARELDFDLSDLERVRHGVAPE